MVQHLFFLFYGKSNHISYCNLKNLQYLDKFFLLFLSFLLS